MTFMVVIAEGIDPGHVRNIAYGRKVIVAETYRRLIIGKTLATRLDIGKAAANSMEAQGFSLP
ncbi:MAG: hypothetical protein OXF88_03140 [Rhodobacteraceae bacterium]|nr:hypothetical protein [Paracoccaceae bacterium]MCY4138611.1 hypothetical protein [Paracoccaceae bacterium]